MMLTDAWALLSIEKISFSKSSSSQNLKLSNGCYVFSPNDAGSRVSNTQYWENLVLEVVLVSESKAL